MKRRILCLMMAMLMTVSLLPVGAGAAVFSDVPSDAWYAEDVRDIQTYGLIYGIGNNLFDPHGKLSLAQAITLAARVHALLNQTVVHENEIPWYQSYVGYADRNGICSAGEFGTNYNGECSRLTMAVLFARVFPRSTERYGNIIESLPDVEDEGYGSSVFYLYRQGVLTGNDEYGTFKPDKSISRAEAAAILNRVMDAGKRKTFTLKVKETPPPEPVFDPAAIYQHFFSNKEYQKDTRDWEGVGEITYELIDLDQNGVPEMILEGMETYDLFCYSIVYYLDGSTVRKATNGWFYGYGGLRYSSSQKGLWFSQTRPSPMIDIEELYRFENGALYFDYIAAHEYMMDSGQDMYYISHSDGFQRELTESEYNALFQ